MKNQKPYNAGKSQSDLEKNWLMMVTTPAVKSGHWFTELSQSGSPEIFMASFDLICEECQKLPAHQMVTCIHKKPRGNKQKDRKIRLQASKSTTFFDSKLKETMGHATKVRVGYYPKEHIDFLFSSAAIVSGDPTPRCYFACFDPNAGDKNHTACILGYVTRDLQYVICGIDTKQTIEYEEFVSFFTDNLVLLHENIRKDRTIPIIAVVESQSSWNGDIISTKVNELVHQKGVKSLENILFLSDKSKQKHGKMRCGVCINSGRLNDMTARLAMAFATHSVRIHSDWVTASELGRDAIIGELCSQLRRFKHFDENQNSGFKSSGVKIKNNNGKEGVLNDDISDALHMFIAWSYWFYYNPEYADQRRMIRL